MQPTSDAELVEAAAGSDALVLIRYSVTADILDPLPALRVLGKVGTGVDDVALAAAAVTDTTVIHAPTYCIEKVSTHTFVVLLSAERHLRTYDAAIRGGS
jgi:D-3-phosphoglycerate dehydrogenase